MAGPTYRGPTFNIDGSNLLNAVVGRLSSSSYTSAFLDRPTSETWVSQQAVVTYPTIAGTTAIFTPELRKQPNGDHYFANFTPSQVFFYRLIGGAVQAIGSAHSLTTNVTTGHVIQFTFSASTPTGTTPTTTLTATLFDVTAGVTLGSFSVGDFTANLQKRRLHGPHRVERLDERRHLARAALSGATAPR